MAALNRQEKWAPTTDPTIFVEWRYTAGRIVDGNQDFGFVVSISSVKVFTLQTQTLSVQRQDFLGDQEFAGHTYAGELTFDDASATYTFKDETDQELVSWQWDQAAQVYRLSITTPELTLTDVVMIAQGPLIPEGGDGNIQVGRVGSLPINSDYYADWTTIKINGQEKGVARVDMQGLRPAETSVGVEASEDYDHRWFAVAVDLNDGSPAWISAWKIEDRDGPFWCVTLARGSDDTWDVFSLTQKDEKSLAAPLEITPLDWQRLPVGTEATQSTGTKWHLLAGISQPNDLINLQVTVPPGQFIVDEAQIRSSWLEEAVGIEVEGTVLGSPVSSVKIAAAESSTELFLNYIPLALA